MGHGDHRYFDLHFLDLAGRRRRALGVSGNNQQVGLKRLNLGQRCRHVTEITGQLVVDHRLHAVFF